MLEAIRLVRDATTGLKDAETEHGPVISDNEAKALVIGLGIGTTPGALIAHGINTTVVEIDPVVHKMALDFFNLSKNHTAYIEDATVFVKNQIVEMATEVQARNAAAKDSSKEDMVLGKYDYIVHDVFTGGAEPVDLFTETFIRSLSYLLKPDGVIAINYATDVFLPSASYVYTTVLSVFPNCRLFRDTDPAESNASSATSDFTNTVLFCRKAKNPFVFRDPIKSDYLGSSIRQAWLKPKYEVSLEPFVGNRNGNGWELDFSKVLTKDRVFELKKWHAASAARHWELMRTVMPDIVWERW
ncbi:MAG: hypothetical protein LQ340_000865 [Diploschistes diacapsis]|nr:MAG: hypothetical protein LQ340_000865 [Diploschistes diacapsis]